MPRIVTGAVTPRRNNTTNNGRPKRTIKLNSKLRSPSPPSLRPSSHKKAAETKVAPPQPIALLITPPVPSPQQQNAEAKVQILSTSPSSLQEKPKEKMTVSSTPSSPQCPLKENSTLHLVKQTASLPNPQLLQVKSETMLSMLPNPPTSLLKNQDTPKLVTLSSPPSLLHSLKKDIKAQVVIPQMPLLSPQNKVDLKATSPTHPIQKKIETRTDKPSTTPLLSPLLQKKIHPKITKFPPSRISSTLPLQKKVEAKVPSASTVSTLTCQKKVEPKLTMSPAPQLLSSLKQKKVEAKVPTASSVSTLTCQKKVEAKVPTAPSVSTLTCQKKVEAQVPTASSLSTLTCQKKVKPKPTISPASQPFSSLKQKKVEFKKPAMSQAPSSLLQMNVKSKASSKTPLCPLSQKKVTTQMTASPAPKSVFQEYLRTKLSTKSTSPSPSLRLLKQVLAKVAVSPSSRLQEEVKTKMAVSSTAQSPSLSRKRTETKVVMLPTSETTTCSKLTKTGTLDKTDNVGTSGGAKKRRISTQEMNSLIKKPKLQSPEFIIPRYRENQECMLWNLKDVERKESKTPKAGTTERPKNKESKQQDAAPVQEVITKNMECDNEVEVEDSKIKKETLDLEKQALQKKQENEKVPQIKDGNQASAVDKELRLQPQETVQIKIETYDSNESCTMQVEEGSQVSSTGNIPENLIQFIRDQIKREVEKILPLAVEKELQKRNLA